MKKEFKPWSVLVVEDNTGDFIIVEDLLVEQISNLDIKRAINFKEASHLLQQNNQVFDAILLDLTLPDKSGQDLITEILKLANPIPVIILTGYTDINFSISSISLGVSDYLLKEDLTAILLYKTIVFAIERKKALFEISESEKRYSDLFQFSPEPMFVCDLQTRNFLSVNQAAIRNYGFSEEAFMTMSLSDIEALPEETSILKTSSQLNLELTQRHQRKNGEVFYVEIHKRTIQFNNDQVNLLIATDISKLIGHIKTVEAYNVKLQQIAWEQSHIVRAPLSRMMGIVNLLKLLKKTAPEFDEWVDRFEESANELDDVIRSISQKTTNQQ